MSHDRSRDSRRRRVRVTISGHVQGVAFRYHTRHQARANEVRGWVRNLPDGRVEALFDGSKDEVASILRWCSRGSPLSRVTGVKTRDEEALEELPSSFDIRG